MANKIQDALLKLDVSNDNHWTADGLPRLDTVKMLAADPTLTRESILAALPGFSRTTAKNGTQPAVVQPQGGNPSNAKAVAPAAPAAPVAVQPAAQNPEPAAETSPEPAPTLSAE